MKKKLLLFVVLLLVSSMFFVGCAEDTAPENGDDNGNGEEEVAEPVEFTFLSNHEFFVRDDGLPGLQELYGFEFPDARITDTGITYTALADGLVDAAMGFATDGRIAAFDLVNLVDDKQYFPVYNPAPVIRKDTLDANPEIADVLNAVAVKIETAMMTQMNYDVDIAGDEPSEVALAWLSSQGFVSEMPDNGTKGPVVVGSKEFTEQLVLGQIAIIALRDAGFNVVDQTGLGGTLICADAVASGDIDMYWEYTGTGWITILGHDDPITDSEEAYNKVKEQYLEDLDQVWLDYAPFDNTYTVMMRQSQADDLGIVTLSDLADYINQ